MIPSSLMNSTSLEARSSLRVSVSRSPCERHQYVTRSRREKIALLANPLRLSQLALTLEPSRLAKFFLDAAFLNLTMYLPVRSPSTFSTARRGEGAASAGATRSARETMAVEKRIFGLVAGKRDFEHSKKCEDHGLSVSSYNFWLSYCQLCQDGEHMHIMVW